MEDDNYMRTWSETIDLLAIALTNHGHEWTNYERSQYEKSVRMFRAICGITDEERAAGVPEWEGVTVG